MIYQLLPLVTLFETFQALFDRCYASAVVNSTNVFLVPFGKWSQVCFVAGQPLGYYASWPLFALTHHLMIWWSAEKARIALCALCVGDDVLICEVADQYVSILKSLKVSISH